MSSVRVSSSGWLLSLLAMVLVFWCCSPCGVSGDAPLIVAYYDELCIVPFTNISIPDFLITATCYDQSPYELSWIFTCPGRTASNQLAATPSASQSASQSQSDPRQNVLTFILWKGTRNCDNTPIVNISAVGKPGGCDEVDIGTLPYWGYIDCGTASDSNGEDVEQAAQFVYDEAEQAETAYAAYHEDDK